MSEALASAPHDRPAAPPIDRARLRKVRWFFFKLGLHILWWDVILARPLLRRFRTPAVPRWQRLARRYREGAIELGGVVVKLGQFLSTRVDLLPPQVTSELALLQDQVPAAPFAQVAAQIEADFRRPLAAVFPWFSPEPAGAASLAQAHEAQLPSGERVVVKVLRPGIATVVETDLRVIDQSIRSLKFHTLIRKQADLDRVADEFLAVTRRELDLTAEGRNAERFAADFRDDPQILAPSIYWDYTAAHTLTMENVAFLRIDDLDGLAAAGIDRREVGRKLFDNYLEQFFVTHFVHADPHPGNLFVKPLPDRSFAIAFVDFGMSVSVPERMRDSMRAYAIGIGTRNARLIVQSYMDGGILLPGGDLDRIEELTQLILDRFSGSLLGQLKDVDMLEYRDLFQQYRELLYTSPFQLQADLLFVFRAMGVLSGMVARFDPELDPLARAHPLARRLAREEWRQRGKQRLAATARALIEIPTTLEDVLTRARRGRIRVIGSLDPENARELRRLRVSVQRQTAALLAAGLLIAGSIWRLGSVLAAAFAKQPEPAGGAGLWLLAGAAVVVVWSLLRHRP